MPQTGEAATVQLAFQCVQLLASDYLSSLPAPLLRKSVEVTALYGSQQVFCPISLVSHSRVWDATSRDTQVDMNVSLTAIGLLWNEADLLGKRGGYGETEGDGSAGAASTSQPLDSALFEDLLRLLLGSLQVGCLSLCCKAI